MLRLEKFKRINLIVFMIFVLAGCQNGQYHMQDIVAQVFNGNVENIELEKESIVAVSPSHPH